MKFGIFYEHQTPRPWDAESEHRIPTQGLASRPGCGTGR